MLRFLKGEDFLRHLLTPNPRDRMSPEEARRHPWLPTRRRLTLRHMSARDEPMTATQTHEVSRPDAVAAPATERWVFPNGLVDVDPKARHRGPLLQESLNTRGGSSRRSHTWDTPRCSIGCQEDVVQTPSAPAWSWGPTPLTLDNTRSPSRIGESGFHVVREADITTYRPVPPLYNSSFRSMTSPCLRDMQLVFVDPIIREPTVNPLGTKRLHLSDSSSDTAELTGPAKRMRTAEEDNG